MKPSNRVLSGFLIVVAVVVVAIVVAARIIAGPLGSVDPDQPLVEHSLDEAFRSIDLEGPWRVEVQAGASHEAHVSGPESVLAALRFGVEEGVLTASLRSGFSVSGPLTLRATVTDLASVRFAGAADAREDGIETDALVVEVLGAAELRVDESTIGELTLLSSGAAEIDFSGSLVTDAHIDMAGASELDITMNGGVLSGRARGAGDVTYGGQVSSVDAATSPAVDLRRR